MAKDDGDYGFWFSQMQGRLSTIKIYLKQRFEIKFWPSEKSVHFFLFTLEGLRILFSWGLNA